MNLCPWVSLLPDSIILVLRLWCGLVALYLNLGFKFPAGYFGFISRCIFWVLRSRDFFLSSSWRQETIFTMVQTCHCQTSTSFPLCEYFSVSHIPQHCPSCTRYDHCSWPVGLLPVYSIVVSYILCFHSIRYIHLWWTDTNCTSLRRMIKSPVDTLACYIVLYQTCEMTAATEWCNRDIVCLDSGEIIGCNGCGIFIWSHALADALPRFVVYEGIFWLSWVFFLLDLLLENFIWPCWILVCVLVYASVAREFTHCLFNASLT